MAAAGGEAVEEAAAGRPRRAHEGTHVLTVAFEPGSFRDRGARVFRVGDEVYRGLGPEAAAHWDRLSHSSFFRELTVEGKLVGTEEVAPGELGEAAAGFTRVLRHERIPFVSYPYEWTFSMLREAALLQLELVDRALQEGMVLKDASAFNVQFAGPRPVFIDVSSFEPLTPGAPWAGYRQFCRTFLYPLLLEAYKGIPFQAWLRGSLEGIPAEHLARVMSARDLLRPGVLPHVTLQSALERRMGGTRRDVRRELADAGFDAALIRANVQRLRRLVERLAAPAHASGWSDYAGCNSYSAGDEARKLAFVERCAAGRTRQLVWDLGCNTGRFSRLASGSAAYAVAMDADPVVVDALYRELRVAGGGRILPLVVNLADPPPALGWAHRERRTLEDRGRPQLTLCLALIHHLVIGANVPLPEVLRYLRGLGGELVIEMVTKDDPMVKRLLLNKADQYADYTPDAFETELARGFTVKEREALASGTRTLYLAEARAIGGSAGAAPADPARG